MVLVSVGVPVRNGARTLRRALRSIQEQTHAELEVLISDNASSDETGRLSREFAAEDPRFRVVRQEPVIPAVRNFRRAFEGARGEFFLWAAHDDWRSPNYVEALLARLQAAPEASLAFSDVVLFEELETLGGPAPLEFDFATEGLPLGERLRKTAQTAPFHIYGLLRSEALRGYPWYESDICPDWPLMQWLAARGSFVRGVGAQLYSYWPAKPKTEAEKSLSNALGRIKPLAGARIAYTCADAVLRSGGAGNLAGSRLRLAWRLYLWQQRGLKNVIYLRSPAWLQALWRRLRGRS